MTAFSKDDLTMEIVGSIQRLINRLGSSFIQEQVPLRPHNLALVDRWCHRLFPESEYRVTYNEELWPPDVRRGSLIKIQINPRHAFQSYYVVVYNIMTGETKNNGNTVDIFNITYV